MEQMAIALALGLGSLLVGAWMVRYPRRAAPGPKPVAGEESQELSKAAVTRVVVVGALAALFGLFLLISIIASL